MKYFITGLATLCIFMAIGNAQAQYGKKNFSRNFWIVGLGINGINDSGRNLSQPFNVKNNWNISSFPSRFSLEKNIYQGLSLEVSGTSNKYKPGKIINGKENLSAKSFHSFDINAKYDLNYLFGQTLWFDPYAIAGYGYTGVGSEEDFRKQNRSGITNHFGIGFNLWVTDQVGLNFQSMGKLGFIGLGFMSGPSHYVQHGLSIVYKFGGIKTFGGRSIKSRSDSIIEYFAQ